MSDKLKPMPETIQFHLQHFQQSFEDACIQMLLVKANAQSIDPDIAEAAQSIMNKLSNVRKAFVHEFGSKDV